MTEQLRLEAVEALAEVLGASPDTSEVIETVADRLVVTATSGERVVFLKASAASSVDTEACAMQLARAAGVAVPGVVAVGDASGLPGQRYLVIEQMPGRPLDPQGPRLDEVMSTVGQQLATLHTVRVDGFGRLQPSAAESGACRIEGSEGTWADALEAIVRQALDAVVEAGDLTSSLSAAWTADVLGLVSSAERSHPTTEASLLHGDLEYFHIFEDAHGFTGFIDFGDCLAGDPAWDIVRLSLRMDNFKDPAPFEDQPDIAQLVRGYGEFMAERLRAWWRPYLVIRALQEAGWCRRYDFDWGVPSAFLRIASKYLH